MNTGDNQIIKSILDNDFYKFTMHNAVIKIFPDLYVRYHFIDRDNQNYPHGFDSEVKNQIEMMRNLSINQEEMNFLDGTISQFRESNYSEKLFDHRFNPDEVSVFIDNNGQLNLTIEGLWQKTILWEVPILSIISELYYKYTNRIADINSSIIHEKDLRKSKVFTEENINFSEFGTRRRYSYCNQERVIKLFKKYANDVLIGTSNVHFAHKFDMKPIGTVAHEWFMVHAALYGYEAANKIALDNWYSVYKGNLGIALSDTYTSDLFFSTIGKHNAERYAGIRHDSGDPFAFIDKTIKFYHDLNIDISTKFIIFSDSLNTDLCVEIEKYCEGKIKSVFGIGTYLTNDVGVKPLNIIIKIHQIMSNDEWKFAVKLSDNQGKATGNTNEIRKCRKEIAINPS